MINFKSTPYRGMVKMLYIPRHDLSGVHRPKDYFGDCGLPGLDDFFGLVLWILPLKHTGLGCMVLD